MARANRSIQLVVLALLSACSASPTTESRAGKNGGSKADCGSSLRLQDNTSSGSGSISFSLNDNTDPCSVDGYVVGSQDSTSAEQTDDGTYVINDVGEGEQDFIVTGETSADSGRDTTDPTNVSGGNLQDPEETAVAAGTLVGLRVNGVSVTSGLTSERTIRLSPVGTIVGSAKLSGQTDHTGIDVYIPGTRYLAKTDAAGSYRLDNVPPGTHNLRFEYTGYGTAALEGISLIAASTTTAPDMLLVTGSGEGTISLLDADGAVIAGDVPTINSRSVKYLLQVSGAPRLMKVAEDGNFANLEWQPFRSIGTYLFKKDIGQGGRATRILSVRTLDGATEGELEKALIIDMFPEVRGASVMTVKATDADDAPSLTISAAITSPKNAVDMRYSLRDDFVGANWVPASDSASIKVTEEGAYTFYLQFRDADLIATDVFSAPVSVDLFPAGSVSFAITTTTARFPADAEFTLSSIQSPMVGTAVKILVASNPDLTGSTEYSLASTIAHSIGSKAESCGTSKIYVAPVYVDPDTSTRYVSDVRPEQSVTYECIKAFAPYPAPTGRLSAKVFANNKLFSWSGHVDGNTVDYGYILDASSGSWTAISTTNQPTGRIEGSAWERGGKFIVFGGFLDDNNTDMIFTGGIYDPTTTTWTAIPAPTPVDNDSVGHDDECDELSEQIYSTPYFTGDHIVIWGNQSRGLDFADEDLDGDDVGCLSSIGYTYSLVTQTWAPMTSPPEIRCDDDSARSPAVVVNNKLFLFGGLQCDNSERIFDDGYVYDPATNTWSAAATGSDPTARFDHIRVVDGNKVYVWGGRTLSGTTITTIGMETGAAYDTISNTWTAMESAPTAVNLSYNSAPFTFETPVAGMIGTKLIIWSGYQNETKRWQGLIYDTTAASSRWSYIDTSSAPRYMTNVLEEEQYTNRFPGDGAAISGSYLYVWSRAATAAELDDPTANLIAAYKPANGATPAAWTQLPTGMSQLPEDMESTLYRNYLRAYPTASGLFLFGGKTPRDVPEVDAALSSGVLHYMN